MTVAAALTNVYLYTIRRFVASGARLETFLRC